MFEVCSMKCWVLLVQFPLYTVQHSLPITIFIAVPGIPQLSLSWQIANHTGITHQGFKGTQKGRIAYFEHCDDEVVFENQETLWALW